VTAAPPIDPAVLRRALDSAGFASWPKPAQRQFYESLAAEVRSAQVRPWRLQARPKQLPPDDPRHNEPDSRGFRCGCARPDTGYNIHLVMAGRGMGKTWTGANWVAEKAALNPQSEWAVLAPTFRDVRKTCFESDVGIIRALLPGEMSNYRRNELQIVLSNGSVIYGYSAENPEKVRGANLWGAWCDELCSWRYPATWYEGLLPALRKGEHPRIIVTTTPRPTRLISDLVGRADGTVHITRGSTWENSANLSDIALTELKHRYEGTRLGRQELEGELLEDLEGALWTRLMLEENRVGPADLPDMRRVVVAVDPATTSDPDADETGIIVAGEGTDGHGYVLDDLSGRLSPTMAMKTAVHAYARWEADCIVAEVNNGGDYVRDLLRNVDPTVPYKTIRASRGKAVRAQPVSALYEQGKIHHVGCFPDLEDQLCLWVPESLESPDRLDACLASGTLVSTPAGDVPIEDIRPGDLAWTRRGWRAILATRLTRRDADVVSVYLSDGRSLTGTPDHRIWTQNRGWAELGTLVWGDRLSGWRDLPSPSPIAASSTSATRLAASGHAASTTHRQHPGMMIMASCTATSTAIITAPSLMATTSITPTSTRSTTTPPTWSQSPRPSTASSMPSVTGWSRSATCRSSAGMQPVPGMPATKATPGTSRQASAAGKAASRRSQPPVSPAAASSTPGSSRRGTVPGGASTAPGNASTWRPSPARSAVPSSSGTSTASGLSPVPVSVVRLCASGARRDVYDLMVDGDHEFTAAGVIVHNCVWAISELRGLGVADWAEAYGTRRCGKCDRMYLVSVKDRNGASQTRKACPHCGEPVPQDEVA
jgi:phage terminase large subunit-like protein